MMQYEAHNTTIGYHTDQRPWGHGQYDGQGAYCWVYCGLNTVPTVLLISTTKQQLYKCFNVFFFYLHYLVMSLRYSFLNTPKQQYFRRSLPEGSKSLSIEPKILTPIPQLVNVGVEIKRINQSDTSSSSRRN